MHLSNVRPPALKIEIGNAPLSGNSNLTMLRIIIIDPALKGETGHHLALSLELSKAAKSLGHLPIWLAHKELSSRLVPDFVQFVPAFSSGIYERQIGLMGRIVKPLVGNRRFLRSTFAERRWEVQLRRKLRFALLNGDRSSELATALRALKPGRSDRIVIHSADPQTVEMLSFWAAKQPSADLPSIHIRTCWSTSTMPFAGYGGGFSQTLGILSSVAREMTLSAETPAGARLLATETGMNVDVCPHLIDEASLVTGPRESNSADLLVGWLGEPRPEKGAGLLPEIIQSVLAGSPRRRVRFLLQCGGRTTRRAREFDAQLSSFGDAVERLDVGIAQDAYLAALARCDVLLLPYDRDAYPPERGSGAALEALLTGKPIVATADTFAAGLVTADSGCTGFDATSFADGILRIADNYQHYLDGAARARERARQAHDRIACYRRLIGDAADEMPPENQRHALNV
jgi:glycosyltransferase involved in cell wall biosynthesis